MAKEYIEREALCKACGESIVKCNLCVAKEIPAADVVEVVHGRWIERKTPFAQGGVSAKCSVCQKNVQYLGNPLKYCPNCGARMDGE